MADQPPRPVALRVQPENIPAELKSLMTWCCWRYEWNGQRWTKVPYTPFTTSKAMANKVSTLRTFQAAYNCLMERADFFDGIFLCFTKDDPFAAGDFDHSTDLSGVPPTYTELSPSGNGLRFIGRGRVPRSCKKGNRELYRHNHFLSVTGHRVEGFPQEPRPIQPELDRLYEEIKSSATTREGTPGTGERGELAAKIPESEWAEARQEQRTNMSRLLHSLRSSAISKKTGKDDTKLGYLLREDYRGFHEKWPLSNVVRPDGSLDASQIRAIMAGAIKGRGFTRPQFIALMSHFFGYECLKKWKTKQAVREEFAKLWDWARSPRTGEYVKAAPAPVARGRAGDHAELLNKAYDILLTFKAGTEALLTTADLADALGVHRRTAATLLSELVTAGRITYRTAYQYSGIVVSFQGGMIYSQNETSNLSDTNNSNDQPEKQPITAENNQGVIIEKNSKGVLQHKHAEKQESDGEAITADEAAPSIYIYNQYCVSSASFDHTPIPCKLDDVVLAAFENLPKDRVNEKTGILTKWPVTNRRIVEFVQSAHPGKWKAVAITYRADRIRKQRKAETFRELEKTKRDALEKKAGSLRKRIAKLEGRSVTDPSQDIRDWAAKEARRLSGQQGLLGWELGRRDGLDQQRIATEGYSQGEQAEFLELVERERRIEPPTPVPRVSLPNQSAEALGLIERLRARQQNE